MNVSGASPAPIANACRTGYQTPLTCTAYVSTGRGTIPANRVSTALRVRCWLVPASTNVTDRSWSSVAIQRRLRLSLIRRSYWGELMSLFQPRSSSVRARFRPTGMALRTWVERAPVRAGYLHPFDARLNLPAKPGSVSRRLNFLSLVSVSTSPDNSLFCRGARSDLHRCSYPHVDSTVHNSRPSCHSILP